LGRISNGGKSLFPGRYSVVQDVLLNWDHSVQRVIEFKTRVEYAKSEHGSQLNSTRTTSMEKLIFALYAAWA